MLTETDLLTLKRAAERDMQKTLKKKEELGVRLERVKKKKAKGNPDATTSEILGMVEKTKACMDYEKCSGKLGRLTVAVMHIDAELMRR